MSDALWAARLHLNSGTILSTEMIRAICEAYVATVETCIKREAEGDERCREEVLKERERFERLVTTCEAPPIPCCHPAKAIEAKTPDDVWFGCVAEMPLDRDEWCLACLLRKP